MKVMSSTGLCRRIIFRYSKFRCLRGRSFNERDLTNSAKVVVINQAMAKKYWPKADPIGAVITIGKGLGPQFEDPPRQVIGIVGDVRETGLGDTDVGVMFLPQSQVLEGLDAISQQCSFRFPGASDRPTIPTRSAPPYSANSRQSTDKYRSRKSGRWNEVIAQGVSPAPLQYAATEYLRWYSVGLGRNRHLRPHVLYS